MPCCIKSIQFIVMKNIQKWIDLCHYINLSSAWDINRILPLLTENLVLEMQKSRNQGGRAPSSAPRKQSYSQARPIKESCAVRKPQRRRFHWGQVQSGTLCSLAKRSPSRAVRSKICPSCLPQRCTSVAGTNLRCPLCVRLPLKRRKRWPVSGLLM